VSHFSNDSMQVGDASGIQSPVSFGGFGSMTRHLSRLSNGMSDSDLQLLQNMISSNNKETSTSAMVHPTN